MNQKLEDAKQDRAEAQYQMELAERRIKDAMEAFFIAKNAFNRLDQRVQEIRDSLPPLEKEKDNG